MTHEHGAPAGRPVPPGFSYTGFLPTGFCVGALIAGYDAHQRLSLYAAPLAREAQRLRQLVLPSLASCEHLAISHDAVTLRNELLNVTRRRVSPGALAVSEYLKEIVPTHADLRTRYANRLNAAPNSVAVSRAVIEAATRPNATVTSYSKSVRYLGFTAFLGLPAVNAWTLYKIPQDERAYGLFRQASELVGGSLAVWRGVPALWAAAKVWVPGYTARPVLAMHVVLQLSAGTAGAAAGSAGFQAVKGFWESQTPKG